MPATAMKARIPAMSPRRPGGGAPGAETGARGGGTVAAAADIALTPAAIVCSAAAAEAEAGAGVYAGRAAVADADTGLGVAGAIPAAAGEAATTVVPQ